MAKEPGERLNLLEQNSNDAFMIRAANFSGRVVVVGLVIAGVSIGQSVAGTNVGMVVGGVVGFMLGSLAAGGILLLTEIEKNTRHTALMFEKLATRNQN